MIRFITPARAINSVMLTLIAVLMFHVLILLGVVPYSVVWGGRIESVEEMRISEAISVAVNGLMLWILAMKSKRLRSVMPERALNALIWAMAILFGLNAIGNLLSENDVERMVFAPLTLLLAALCARVALAKEVGRGGEAR